jgi:mRNA interferase MazF
MVAKVRPCLILSSYPLNDELALVVIIPHTTAVRGNRWEFPVKLPMLQTGVFHLQQIRSVPLPSLMHKLGSLPPTLFTELKSKLISELGLNV